MLQKVMLIRGACGILSLAFSIWAVEDFLKTDQYASLREYRGTSWFVSYFIRHLFWAMVVAWIGWSAVLLICHKLESLFSGVAEHDDKFLSFLGRLGVEVIQMPGIIVFPVISNKLSLYFQHEKGAHVCLLAILSLSFHAIMLLNYTDYGLFEMVECIFLAIVFGLRKEDIRHLFIFSTVFCLRRLAVFVIKEYVRRNHDEQVIRHNRDEQVTAMANFNELVNAVNRHTTNLNLQVRGLSRIARARRHGNHEELLRLSIQMKQNLEMLQAASQTAQNSIPGGGGESAIQILP